MSTSVMEGVNLYMFLQLQFSLTLNLPCFMGTKTSILAIKIQNVICDTVIAFIQFHPTVREILKVDDDISVSLMGKYKGNCG